MEKATDILQDLQEYLAQKNPDALAALQTLSLAPSILGPKLLDAVKTDEALSFDPNQSTVMLRVSLITPPFMS